MKNFWQVSHNNPDIRHFGLRIFTINKMIGVRSLLKSAPVARTALQQTRNFNDAYTAVSSPPTNQISKGARLAHGVVIGVSILFVPAWVLLHLREYKGEK